MSEMNHDDLNQLVQELRDNKPAAPLPPAQFTADLRRQLLEEYAGKRRLRFDFEWLGSMAGSVAAFIVLGAAVLVTWFAFSRGSAAGNSLHQVGDWQSAAGADRAWLISASPPPGTNLSTLSIRPIPFTLEIGYELATAPEALLLVELVPAEEAEVAEGHGLPLAPYGSSQWLPITGPEGKVTVEIRTSNLSPGQQARDIVPQVSFMLREPETTDFFYQGTLDNARWIWSDEADTASTGNTMDHIWLISVHQAARTTASAPIDFEVVVGYELVSVPEAVIKLHYAAPDWETRQVNGRVPMDGMSEFVPITADADNVTFEFTGSAQEMARIVGTQNPVPVIQLGNFVEHDDGRGRELQLNAVETFAGYPFSLATTEEIRYTGEAETPASVEPAALDSVEVLSVMPSPETTISGTTTFEVRLAYNLASLPEAIITATISEKLGNAGGRGVASSRTTVQRGQGQLTILVPLNPAGELSGSANLALMLQMQPDERSAPLAMEMPDAYRWRYEP